MSALLGGMLIGLAAALALVLHGRIAGISGTLGRVFDGDGGRAFRVAFLAGLLVTGAILSRCVPSLFAAAPHGYGMLALAGVLVGGGTALGNGCTSGHGVCGIGRGSPRSLVAVATFMTTGAITVALVGAA